LKSRASARAGETGFIEHRGRCSLRQVRSRFGQVALQRARRDAGLRHCWAAREVGASPSTTYAFARRRRERPRTSWSPCQRQRHPRAL
jgi:hypothetical protein